MRARISLIALFFTLTIVSAAIVLRPKTVVNSAESEVPSVSPTPRSAKAVQNTSGVIFVTEWDGVKLERPEADWKRSLTEFEYYVLREKGTEQPYSGKLTDNKQAGTYHCAACGLALFSSKHKFDSQTGWPSFYQPVKKEHLAEIEDKSIPSEIRTEVVCARCGSHQGHVFDDGPKPTGLRYCINSVALKFSRSK